MGVMELWLVTSITPSHWPLSLAAPSNKRNSLSTVGKVVVLTVVDYLVEYQTVSRYFFEEA